MTHPTTDKRTSPWLPLGALAAGLGLMAGGSWAQAPAVPPTPAPAHAHAHAAALATAADHPADAPTLTPVPVRARAETDMDTVRATTSSIGKGNQALRDLPQSVTVLTERLLDDRQLDDFKDVLRTISGVTFLAGETGEEDIRLRGFSLAQAGDLYADGLRDVALSERDAFNNDRIEVLKGSASMLFGRGSTGGVVNQVNKQPFGLTEHELTLQLGSGHQRRVTGDFNVKTGQDAALRVNAVVHRADNVGAQVDKTGLAPSFRWGIGTANEFSVALFHLSFDNVPGYNHPWFIADGRIRPVLPADRYYGLASDYLRGETTHATVTHTHRFGAGRELRTTLRHGRYERELWASVIRFGSTDGVPTTLANVGPQTLITRTPKGRVALSDITQLQSDFGGRFQWGGRTHELLVGVDVVQENARRANNFAGPASGLTTTVGMPNDGARQDDLRGAPPFNTFDARSVGVYAQDMLHLGPTLKLLVGLRLDHLNAGYMTQSTTAATGPNAGNVTPGTSFERSDTLASPRAGLIYQPDEQSSYYLSFGTSYNTAGDTYQFTPAAPDQRVSNTAPEKSRNLELGAKWDLLQDRLSVAAALFRSEKTNERNTDPDTAATQELLSGRRHATGLELNIAGRLTPAWEAWLNWTWIPEARIDDSNLVLNAAGTGPQVQGDRPGLTPRHSASLWTTYRLNPAWRAGGGVNLRSAQNPEGARHITADSFAALDLMLELRLNANSTLQLNVANATDELYADQLYRGFYTPGAGRSAQVMLKTRF